MKRSVCLFFIVVISVYLLIGCGGGSHDPLPLSTSNNTINYILECDKTSLDHTKDQTVESKNTKIFLPNYSMKKDFNISIKRIDTQNLSSDNLYSLLNNLGLDTNS